jgi:hypothetical protein
MTQEEIDNFKILDKIDFLPYIKKFKGKDMAELICAVEADYDATELTDNPCCEGYIFNNVSSDDLIDYLKKRYGSTFDVMEVITYKII